MEIIVKNFDENNKKDRSIKTTKKAKDKVDKNNKSDVEQVRRTLQLVLDVSCFILHSMTDSNDF